MAAPLDPDLQDLPGSPDNHLQNRDDQRPVRLPGLSRRCMPLGAEGHLRTSFSYGRLSPYGETTSPFSRLRKAADPGTRAAQQDINECKPLRGRATPACRGQARPSAAADRRNKHR